MDLARGRYDFNLIGACREIAGDCSQVAVFTRSHRCKAVLGRQVACLTIREIACHVPGKWEDTPLLPLQVSDNIRKGKGFALRPLA